MTQTTVLQYEAPWPVYALDWCKTLAPGHQQRPRSAFRLAVGSFTEDYRNRIAIVGLQDERLLVEDDFSDYPDFATLCEASHGYPVTAIQWQPASSQSYNWSQKSPSVELLATTGDVLRLWEYHTDVPVQMPNYVGRAQQTGGHRLQVKTALSGQSKAPNASTGAPITNFSWNENSPNTIVTCSIDTTCTVWNLDTGVAITQLIAHDREVYDVAWLPRSTDIFVSVGADGSLRAFDLRSLEHSTILYETPAPKNVHPPGQDADVPTNARPPTAPLLRIAFNPVNSNYMATFHMDGSDVQILDMRNPGQPVMELRGHRAQVNALGWGSTDNPLLATAGDDCQLLLWDLSSQTSAPVSSPRNPSSRLNSPRAGAEGGSGSSGGKKRLITDPIMGYSGTTEISNIAWSPQIAGMSMNNGLSTASGEWLAVASGRTIKALKV